MHLSSQLIGMGGGLRYNLFLIEHLGVAGFDSTLTGWFEVTGDK